MITIKTQKKFFKKDSPIRTNLLNKAQEIISHRKSKQSYKNSPNPTYRSQPSVKLLRKSRVKGVSYHSRAHSFQKNNSNVISSNVIGNYTIKPYEYSGEDQRLPSIKSRPSVKNEAENMLRRQKR